MEGDCDEGDEEGCENSCDKADLKGDTKRKKVVLPPATDPLSVSKCKGSSGTATAKLHDIAEARKSFVARVVAEGRQHGQKVKRADAQEAWIDSLERAELLAAYSVNELKRRKFLPKGATRNIFAERVANSHGS